MWPAAAQGRNETLTVVVESGPNSMDILGVGANHPSYQASWNLYDRLMTYGVKTLPDGTRMYDYNVLKPELAESWQFAPDGMSVTFKLKKDAKFHDGTPVTAKDVKWSFDRAVTVGGFPTFQMKAGSLEKPEQFVIVGPLIGCGRSRTATRPCSAWPRAAGPSRRGMGRPRRRARQDPPRGAARARHREGAPHRRRGDARSAPRADPV